MLNAQFEALLLAPILAPAFGGEASPLGNYGTFVLAERVAASDPLGFGHLLAERLDVR
ncbi:MAG: hypothetical protein ACLQPV_11750 [Vulcanimicrobiaceae bacterium]